MASSVPGRREKLSEAAHLAHPIHAPLSDASVSELIEAMQFRPGDRVVDIGCGTGEWLFRIATATGTAGLGLDTSKAALRLARMRSRQVSPAPSFQAMDAAHWHPDTAFQHALSVGSTHALGGLQSTLRRAHEILEPDGRLLVGDGIWQVSPTPAALGALGASPAEFPGLEVLLSMFVEHGYAVVDKVVSTEAEWDEYETRWSDDAEQWGKDNPADPDSRWIIETAREHRRGYWDGYRGVLGFVTAVLVAADS